jgi:dCTP deaminase
MILSQIDLRKAVQAGEIEFNPPLEERQWGEASIDLRLGRQFTKIQKSDDLIISVAKGLSSMTQTKLWNTVEIDPSASFGKPNFLILEPGEFILGITHEAVKVPNNLIARVEGRSTYARMGLSMHQTAPWIQPGWKGPIILEIMNNGPLRIALTPLVDRPCQLTFFELKTPVDDNIAYGSRATDTYQNQSHPLEQRQK